LGLREISIDPGILAANWPPSAAFQSPIVALKS
jgi:hypothetical protein